MSESVVGSWRRFAWRDGLDLLTRAAAGAVFLYTGIAKALDSQGMLLAVHGYRLAPGFLEKPIAAGLPWLEIALAVFLLGGLCTRFAGISVAALSLAFIVAMAQAKVRGLAIGCGCFGGSGAGTGVSWFDLGRDLPLLAGGVYLAWRVRGPWRLDRFLDADPDSARGLARDEPTGAVGLRTPQVAGQRRALRLAMPLAVVVVIAVIALAVTRQNGAPAAQAGAARGSVSVAGAVRATLIPAGSQLPDFSAPALGGGRVLWSTYRGAPTVLMLWTPWCPDCEQELPIVNRVAQAFPGVRLTSIVTAIGQEPGPSPEQYMLSHHFTFPVALDSADQRLADAFGVTGYPTIYYVNAAGMVHQATVGVAPESVIRSLMRAIAG